MDRVPRRERVWFRVGAVAALTACVGLAVFSIAHSSAGKGLPGGFRDTVVLSGLTRPTAVAFARDGRVFVAQQDGRIEVFDGLDDPVPTLFADLSTEVYNFWDRGLLGLALDPRFPERPFVYVAYTYDAPIGGSAPRWGRPGKLLDVCPDPPGILDDGCVVSARLSRLHAKRDRMIEEKVLIEDWCLQFNTHSVGDIGFGSDGALFMSGGDGASWTFADWGQRGRPRNPCGDPPAGVGGRMVPPTAEGGALRAQDLTTPGDPVTLDGAVIRVSRDTGEGLPDNPLAQDRDANARRIVAYGFKQPFRFAVQPGTDAVWVGDVGLDTWEEINVISSFARPVENFGWPCYEGPERQHHYAENLQISNLAICKGLYADADREVTKPHFAYSHSKYVATGDVCPPRGSAISGLVFYERGSYPEKYRGALFFADYSRGCIWAMRTGEDGVPDPHKVSLFARASAVDLAVGPGGDLYYVDLVPGTVRRIAYQGGQSN